MSPAFVVRAARNGALATLVAIAHFGCVRHEPASPVRGVVIVDVDTLRADALGVYGNRSGTSPAIDAFAGQATTFEWAYSQAPYTLPSQTSILTSVYPWAHRVLGDQDRLSAEATTIAEVFTASGWLTGAFVDGGFMRKEFGLSQGFATYHDANGRGLAGMQSKIDAWLREVGDRRFLLLVHTYDVHSPYAPPEPMRSRFAAGAPSPSLGFEPTSDRLEEIRASQWRPPQVRLPSNDIEYARAMYHGEVAFVDAWFGRFVEELKQSGLMDGTVVAIVSDHGEEFQEHGSVLHEKLYTTVTRVPLIIGMPGQSSGHEVRSQVETLDLMPTLLELADLEIPAGVHGRSLADSVRRGVEPTPRGAFGMSPFYGGQRFAADENLHAIFGLQSGGRELFAYRQDPNELKDLAAARPEDASRLARALAARRRQTPLARGLREDSELDDQAEAELRALGYLQ